MLPNIKIKKSLLFSILFIFGFFIGTNYALAANISFSTISSYRVGDIVRVKVIVSSDVSINAVSANISYPVDKLSITSISKSGSIISLWAKEPSFSNKNGTANLEGVVLSGYTGNFGEVVTINFKAKSEGQANLEFTKASVLANDGNGTEVLANKNSQTINILKALPTPEKVTEEKPEIKLPITEVVVEKAKEAVVQIREVEKTNNLPNYSLVIILLLIIIILLILIIAYGLYYIKKLWFVFKKKISKTSNEVLNDLEILKKDLDDEIIITDKIRKNEPINLSDVNFQIKLEKDIKDTEEKIVKEIKELETKE